MRTSVKKKACQERPDYHSLPIPVVAAPYYLDKLPAEILTKHRYLLVT